MKNLKFSFLLLICLQFVQFSFGQEKKGTKTEHKNGLTTVTFNTPKGKVTVTLPEKTHAGDVISGTVIAKPKGKNDKQKAKNKNILNGYVVEIEKENSTPKTKKIKWKIPSEISNNKTEIVFKDEKGGLLGKVSVPVLDFPRESIIPENLNDLDFKIPKYLRAGETEQITGAFDGDYSNSKLIIDEQRIDILAESPGALFIKIPEPLNGENHIEVIDQDLSLDTYTNIIDLSLHASKLTLGKGESSTIFIEVSGLNKFESVVPVSVSNLSPANIFMDGGNEQHFLIKPDDIDAEGFFRKDLKVTASKAGGFSVRVEVLPYSHIESHCTNEK